MSSFALPLRPCEAADEMAAEGFSVEDLLDLDKDELCETAPAGMEEERSSDSRESSAVSYELMPPPAMDLPAHDAEELEWVSRVLDDSLAEIPQPICALSTEAVVPRVRAKRSKRLRATVWSLSDTVSSSPTASSSSSFFLPGMDSPDEPPRRPKKRGRKPKHHPPPSDRRCSHCGVQKSPQWRAGPAGAKSLCNACGVRFKSGRLLPEYRPAMSPTFVRNLHSNSHRKVLEMRRKVLVPTAPPVASF